MDAAMRDWQYSPSRWVKRMDPDAVVADHIAATIRHAEAAVQGGACTVERDVRYGAAPGELLDLYWPRPADTPPRAVFAYIHGGYWQALGKEHGAHMCGVLARAGIVTASLGYDLCPSVTVLDIIGEIVHAAHWLRGRFPDTPLVLGGHSAGAHLAAAALIALGDHHGLAGLFLLSGIYDLVPIRLAGRVNTDNCLHLTTEHDALVVSPAHQLAQTDGNNAWETLHVVVAVGAVESDEFKRQSAEFAAQLRPLCKSVALVTVPDRDHFDVTEVLSDASCSPTDSLLRLLETVSL